MWFLFGFVTITIAIAFEFWRRHESMWSPDDKHEGYDYKLLKSKNRTTGLLLGTRCAAGANFWIKRQSYFDTFFKRVGVSSEFETGDKSFDDAYYLITDNLELHQVLASNPKLRTAIDVIMKFSGGGFNAKTIYCRNGRIWIKFDTEFLGLGEDIASVVRKLGHPLSLMANVIADLSKAGASWKDPFVVKAAILLAISSGLAINVVVQLVRLNYSHVPFTPDYLAILFDAVIYAFVLVPVLLFLAIKWLGRGARTHLVLLELASIGAVALTLTLALEMRDLNMSLDRSAEKSFKAQIVNKVSSKGRRSTDYYLVMNDWRCKCGTIKFEVSQSLFNSLAVGNTVLISQKEGYLGYPWVSDILYRWGNR